MDLLAKCCSLAQMPLWPSSRSLRTPLRDTSGTARPLKAENEENAAFGVY